MSALGTTLTSIFSATIPTIAEGPTDGNKTRYWHRFIRRDDSPVPVELSDAPSAAASFGSYPALAVSARVKSSVFAIKDVMNIRERLLDIYAQKAARRYGLSKVMQCMSPALVGKSLRRNNLGSYPGLKETCQPRGSQARI